MNMKDFSLVFRRIGMNRIPEQVPESTTQGVGVYSGLSIERGTEPS